MLFSSPRASPDLVDGADPLVAVARRADEPGVPDACGAVVLLWAEEVRVGKGRKIAVSECLDRGCEVRRGEIEPHGSELLADRLEEPHVAARDIGGRLGVRVAHVDAVRLRGLRALLALRV